MVGNRGAEVGLHVWRGSGLEPLVDRLAQELSAPRDDPFAEQVVAVPGAGVQRYVAQRLSTVLGAGSDGDGVCAGVAFPSVGRLLADVVEDVSGLGRGEDPWRVGRLQWAVLDAVEALAAEGWAAPLVRHVLGADVPGARLAAARRIAGLYHRYAEDRPALLDDWAAGRDVDTAGEPLGPVDAWQPHLWRHLREELGTDPAARRAEVVAALAAGPVGPLPARLFLLAPPRLSDSGRALVSALAAHRRVVVGLVDHSPGSQVIPEGAPTAGHPLSARLGREALAERDRWVSLGTDEVLTAPPSPATLLGRLQADVRADEAEVPNVRPTAVPDGSLVFHASHGPARQVEVLRDVLLGLLADDPTLEPRDVVVLCPQVETMAPLLTALFAPTADPAANPGHALRLRVSDPGVRTANPVLGALAEVLEIVTTRIEATRVLDLLRLAPVASRFGLTDEDQQRLRELVERAGIRWGLDGRHRAELGLAGVAQNTWQAGLDRLLTGVAMDETGLVDVGGVLPYDDVAANDVARIGVLAEVVARLATLTDAARTRRPASEWLSLLRETMGALTDARGDDAWQLTHAHAGLADLAEELGQHPTPVGLGDVRVLLAELMAGQSPRATFGTGSLVVTSPQMVRHVPHRVVVLLGHDDGIFPRAQAIDGDDLAARAPRPGDADLRAADRQALLDAVMAATERLVVISSQHHPVTNEPLPLAVPLAELLAAADAVVALPGGARRALTVEHPLQPFSAEAFTAPRRGFDEAAFRGVQVLRRGARSTHVRWPLTTVPGAEPAPLVELAALTEVLQHPIKALLKQRGGLPAWEPEDDEDADQMPLALDGLRQWQLKDRALRLALTGADPDAAIAAELRRGEVPPDPRSQAGLGRLPGDVRDVLGAAPPAELRREHDVAIDVRGRAVRGRLVSHGGEIVALSVAKLNGRSLLEGWVQLLALKVAEPDVDWRWRHVHPKQSHVLVAPNARWAAFHLHDLVGMADRALTEPLPFQPRLSWTYTTKRRTGAEGEELWSALSRLSNWGTRTFDAETDVLFRRFYPTVASLRDEAPAEDDYYQEGEPSRFGTYARRVFAPVYDALEDAWA